MPRAARRRPQQEQHKAPSSSSCHRHYKYTARAIQRPGEDTVAFRLTTPAGGAGLPLVGGYKATLLGLSARPARGKAHYSLDLGLSFLEQKDAVVGGFMMDVFTDDDAKKMSVPKMVVKCQDFKAKVDAAWPYFPQVPHLVGKPTRDGNGHVFELFLPPFTGFYTADPHFWTVFRFPDEHVHPTFGASGGLGARYGVTNRSDRNFTVRAKSLLDTEDLNLLYLSASDDVPPRNSQLHLEVEYFSSWIPQTLTEEQPLNAQTAAAALSRLIDVGLYALNLRGNMERALVVDVESTPGSVLLRSDRFEGPASKQARVMVIHVRLSEVLKNFFATKEAGYAFASNAPRVVALPVRNPPAEDVLAGHYPLHLVAVSQPGAHHFVHGRGWVSLLGLLSDTNKCIGRQEWVELLAGQTELRLALVDRWCKPLVVTEVVEFVIYLEMVDFF